MGDFRPWNQRGGLRMKEITLPRVNDIMKEKSRHGDLRKNTK